MGLGISWVAQQNAAKKKIAKLFDLRLCSPSEDPTSHKTIFNGFSLPNNWFLLAGNKVSDFPPENLVKQLSLDKEVLTGLIHEGSMVSNIVAWRKGEIMWSVSHDSSLGDDHLEIVGNPPESLASIVKNYRDLHNEGSADSMFEIPVELGYELTGFRYDALSNNIESKFYIPKGSQIYDTTWFLKQLVQKIEAIEFNYLDEVREWSPSQFVFGSLEENACRLNMMAVGSDLVICNPVVSFHSKRISDFIESNYLSKSVPPHTVAICLSQRLPVMNAAGEPIWVFSADSNDDTAAKLEELSSQLKDEFVPRFQRYCFGKLTEHDVEILKDQFHAEYHLFASLLVNGDENRARALSDWYLGNEKIVDIHLEDYTDFVDNALSSSD